MICPEKVTWNLRRAFPILSVYKESGYREKTWDRDVCTISCSCHYWHIFPSLLEVTPILPECFIFSDLLIAEIFILTLIRSCHFQYGSPFSWFNYFLLLLICTSFFFASKKFSLLKLFDQKLPATCKSKWM
jgi:hypothetical protein